jgi:hypothetical protein
MQVVKPETVMRCIVWGSEPVGVGSPGKGQGAKD